MAENSTEIQHEFPPMFRVYKDGRVERLVGLDVVPASVDSDTGVQSKDIVISPENGISARLFLPKNADPRRKLPLLVYFHGGGFVVESAFSSAYHNHLMSLMAEAEVVVVSVDYRLAPEHPLPIAYEDCWLALKWVASQSTGEGHEPWIQENVDFNHVYLGGDSAGANIAHNIAMRFGLEKLDGINLDGIFLNCPYFWGKDPIGNEGKDPNTKAHVDKLWLFVCPNTTGLDDPLINPVMDPNLSKLGCKKVLIYVAENDVLKERGHHYKDALMKCGWGGEVEIEDVKEEIHVFSVFFPDGENAKAMMKRVARFMKE